MRCATTLSLVLFGAVILGCGGDDDAGVDGGAVDGGGTVDGGDTVDSGGGAVDGGGGAVDGGGGMLDGGGGAMDGGGGAMDGLATPVTVALAMGGSGMQAEVCQMATGTGVAYSLVAPGCPGFMPRYMRLWRFGSTFNVGGEVAIDGAGDPLGRVMFTSTSAGTIASSMEMVNGIPGDTDVTMATGEISTITLRFTDTDVTISTWVP